MKMISAAFLLAIAVAAVRPLAAEGWICDADARKLCPGKNPATACLIEHADELSSGCKRALGQKPVPAWPGPCKTDVEKFCADQRSKSRCLIDHESELAPGCATMVSGWSKKGAEPPSVSGLGACSGDAARLCAGQRSISLCLVEREKELSPACATTVQGWSKQGVKHDSSWIALCSKDAAKVCPGKGPVDLCLMEHKDALSAGCRNYIAGPLTKKAP